MKTRGWFFCLLFLWLLFPTGTPAAQTVVRETWEISANKLQPPATVMDIAGLRSGMIIGEIGAGRGRYTVHLAQRVGAEGKVYANDIDPEALGYLKERCRREGLANVEVVRGRTDDPLFPRTGLDMVFMVMTYHHLEKRIEMLRNTARYLKPGAALVMVEPLTADTQEEFRDAAARLGRDPVDINILTLDSVRRDAAAAGLEFVRMDRSLKTSNIFILRNGPVPRPPAH